MIENVNEVIEYLEYLADGGDPYSSDRGLCVHLGCMFGDEYWDIPSLYCKSWEHYSGIISYPVPAPDGGCPKEVFWRRPRENNWGDNPYGNLRRDLCRHIAKCLREEYEV